MPSKLDLVLIAGSIAALMGWIEHGHSVVIDSPDPIELASLAPAPACTADDSIRYGMSQMVFSGDGFVVDTGNSFVQLFDCHWRAAWRFGVVGRTEKDNAETPRPGRGRRRSQSQRRDGEERNRGESGNDREDRLATGCISRGFSVFVLCDSC